MSDKFEKKVVFDVEVLPHLFILSYQCVKGYERFDVPHSVHTPMAAYQVLKAYENYLFIGYNSNGYDDYICSAIIKREGNIQPEELFEISRRIIELNETPKGALSFKSYDCFDPIEAGMRSLKMFCGSAGYSTYDSPYSFKDDRRYTPSEIEEMELYCNQDVDYTTSVFLGETAFYEASLARLDILEEAGVTPKAPLAMVCCRSAAFGRRLFEGLCSSRDPLDDRRTTIKFCRDYAQSPYEEVRSAYQFYLDIVREGDETSSDTDFYKRLPPAITLDGVDVTLGWGGAHGALDKYTYFAERDKGVALCYVDVSSMYPTLLVEHDLFPKTFTPAARYVYEKVYRSRLTYKANHDEAKSQACKRIIASLTGMLKDKFACFRAAWANNSIVVNGQLSILDLCCRLLDGGMGKWHLVQVNTDGVMMEVPDNATDLGVYNEIVQGWCADYKFGVSGKRPTALVQSNVNNYYMVCDGKETRKGITYNMNERYFRNLVAVRRATVDCLCEGITPHEALKRYTNIRDYYVLIKNTDTFPYLWDLISDEKKEARCIRCLAVKNNVKEVLTRGLTPCYYIKARRADAVKGDKLANFPTFAIEVGDDMRNYDEAALWEVLDIDYYADLVQSAIKDFKMEETTK